MKKPCFMRTKHPLRAAILALLLAFSLQPSALLSAATTIDAGYHYAYGANIGWMDWRGDVAHGAVIGEYVCSGFIYAANVGWINLGSGTPTDGIYYQNLSADDFGVNQDGAGNLRGYAWGANIGWINFEDSGAPRVDLVTGNLSGCVWSANCGWIGLSNAFAYVQTDTISPGLLDTNGLPIAWELTYFGQTNIDANADPDHDGASNMQEYLAGTNPLDTADNLRVTSFGFLPGGGTAAITWSSVPTRLYRVLSTEAIDASASWADAGPGLLAPDPSGLTTSTLTNSTAQPQFYRIQAIKPLSP